MRMLAAFVALSLAIFAPTLYADTLPLPSTQDPDPWAPKHFSEPYTLFPAKPAWVVFGGLAYTDYFVGTQNRAILVQPGIETDGLVQTGESGHIGYIAGIEREWLFANTDRTTVRGIALGISLRADPANFSGNVNQFQTPPPALTYTYDATPVDFIGQVVIYLTRYKPLDMMPYLIGGFGFSDINLTFTETPLPQFGGNIVSSSSWKTIPVGVIGAGLRFDFTPLYFLRVQYLYHARRGVSLNIPNNPNFTGSIPINLNEQSADVILSYKIP